MEVEMKTKLALKEGKYRGRWTGQGIEQMVPANRTLKIDTSKPIEVTPMLGGLHADYLRAA